MQPHPAPRPRGSKGFTLAELLAVMAITGLVLAMAFPVMSGMIRANRITHAINRVTADLAYSRILAVRTGRTVTVAPITGSSGYTITVNEAAGARIVRTVDFADDAPGAVLSLPGSAVTFNSRGHLSVPGSAGTVRLTLGTRADSVKLFASGRTYRVD